MLTRRDFLRTSTLIALAPTVPGFLARTAQAALLERDGRILVVIQLDGGNDGINTVVPFKDDGYGRHRKALRLPADQLIKVNDQVGLHPAMREAGKLLESQRLAVLPSVGYPNPNRSHFESMAIWQTARFDAEERKGLGWLGRAMDDSPSPASGVPASVYVGSGVLPVAVQARRVVASALTRPRDFRLAPGVATTGAAAPAANDLAAFVQRSALDAYTTAKRMAALTRTQDSGARYPGTELARQLKLVARLMKMDVGTRVFYARQPGYDTHAVQRDVHALLLGELAGALRAFLDDLTAAKLAERVTVLTFSEFGRTVRENASEGTDHGTSGPMFLAGPRVQPAVIGTMPSLLDLDPAHGDLRMTMDFRRVYATVLEDWFGLPADAALNGTFERLPLFRI
jgi:uncharacterized protein (DUF1501 family)